MFQALTAASVSPALVRLQGSPARSRWLMPAGSGLPRSDKSCPTHLDERPESYVPDLVVSKTQGSESHGDRVGLSRGSLKGDKAVQTRETTSVLTMPDFSGNRISRIHITRPESRSPVMIYADAESVDIDVAGKVRGTDANSAFPKKESFHAVDAEVAGKTSSLDSGGAVPTPAMGCMGLYVHI